jgi:tetraacyldisaccharide 4'-kinase
VLLRGLLRAATPFYGAAVALRNQSFDRNWRTIHRAPCPVVSIGNLTTGGTGKTPLVAWTVATLCELGARPGIVSRGYHSLNGQENDEKLLLDQLCPGTPQVLGADRVASARQIVAEHGCDVAVLDDGFQHRRLARDLDVVLIDAVNPFGFGALLPRGLLREPASSLSRANVVIVTRVDQVSAASREETLRIIRSQTPAPVVEVRFAATRLINCDGEAIGFGDVNQKSAGACCGIGNPEGYFRAVESIGLVAGRDRCRAFPDHHHYSEADVSELARWSEQLGLRTLLVTRKDLVKLRRRTIGPASLWGLDIAPEFVAGESLLRESLSALLSTS